MRGIQHGIAAACLVCLLANVATADAPADLKQGVERLAAGEAAAALPLLESAAEGLPASVEAHLALGDCRLQLGQIEKALASFRQVRALSPNHRRAKEIIDALASQEKDFDSKFAYAEQLIASGEYLAAQAILLHVIWEPYSDEELDRSRLLLKTAKFFTLTQGKSKNSAMSDFHKDGPYRSSDPNIRGAAQVLDALLVSVQSKSADLDTLLSGADKLPAPWPARAVLARAAQLALSGDDPVAASRQLRQHADALPKDVFSWWAIPAVKDLLSQAESAHGAGRRDEALAILWPMFSAGDTPAAGAAAELNWQAGWITGRMPSRDNLLPLVAQVAALVPSAATASPLTAADLAPLAWSADLLLAVGAEHHLDYSERLLELARTAGQRSTASGPAEKLSPGTDLQLSILARLASTTDDETARNAVVVQVRSLLDAHAGHASLALLLQRIVVLADDAAPTAVQLHSAFATMADGPSQRLLLKYAAAGYLSLARQLDPPATQTVDPAAPLARADAIALVLESRATAAAADKLALPQEVQAIVNLYAKRRQWTAAQAAVAAFFQERDPAAAAVANAQILLRRQQSQDQQRLAAQLQLAEKLPEELTTVLAAAMTALPADGDAPLRERLLASVDPMISHYTSLERLDLARAMIAALAGKEDSPAADWALWSESQLLAGTAAEAIQAQASRFEKGRKLEPHPAHQKEMDLLGQLLTQHPRSRFAAPAASALAGIPQIYEHHQAFAASEALLTTFVKKHPGLLAAEQLEHQALLVLFRRAEAAFEEAAPHEPPPVAMSAEYQAAVLAAAAWLKAHPAGPHSAQVERRIFDVAKTYGQINAWAAARTVIAEFGNATPDFRHPSRLRLLTAVAWLGELDRDHALEYFQLGLLPGDGDSAYGDASYSAIASNTASGFAPPALRLGESYGPPGTYPASGPVPTPTVVPSAEPGQPGMDAPNAGPPLPVAPQPYPSTSPAPSGYGYAAPSRPENTALAMIQQAQRRQSANVANMEAANEGQQGNAPQQGQQQMMQQEMQQLDGTAIATTAGTVLSEAEMKRQDDAADQAYRLLIALLGEPESRTAAADARSQVFWLFGFLEGEQRFDAAANWIERYLTDQPDDPAQTALAYQLLQDRLHWAGRTSPSDRIDLAFLDQRHELFAAARKQITVFMAKYLGDKHWRRQAQMLQVESHQQEARLAAKVSSVRASGLLVQAARTLLEVLRSEPDHPAAASFPQQLWNIGEHLHRLGQRDRAIYVFSQIPIYFPLDTNASLAVRRIAELHAQGLSNPLKAVETYQEYLNLAGADPTTSNQIYDIAERLAASRRYLEALHVYDVFVDSFPTDERACLALQGIGRTHQANEAWEEALKSFQRVLDEYPTCASLPDVKLAIAECYINLSEWAKARKLYEEFAQAYPEHGQAAMVAGRSPVLKQLDRYQTLLSDKEVDRNKDDAQFQIARIVLNQLGNQVKAIAEFRKVTANFPGSDLGDDAQLEIGKTLLALDRGDEARTELAKVATNFPGSPFADDALYIIGSSYQQQAERLAVVTSETAWARAYERNQQLAYQQFNDVVQAQAKEQSARRAQLKGAGKSVELGLDEAANSFRYNGRNFDNISNSAKLAEQQAETESALQVANRQDRINEAYREAVAQFSRVSTEYPLGDKTDDALIEIAQIYETRLKDRAAAMKTYQRVVELFPGTPVAEDAAWKVAAFYEQEGQFAAAASAFREFTRTYPASSRVADAQFALAEMLEQLGKWNDAMDAYEIFRQKFAGHAKANLASDQINWIKAYRK
ncbi:tetratricopeptide repeat protein [Lignipirellula cremea]|uniref:Tol-pal system protein YbgF n=1 Tax=Lignipirellula cremea TaxID=2528010 RepID=A0A518DW23_9BACT|nr:tetratricopeptide repeat protein [Lignipirellula cremea]QDU96024.1 tol-pal system protein YbgF [Lignipirellula cremea]